MRFLLNTAAKTKRRIILIGFFRSSVFITFFWALGSLPFILLDQFLIIKFNEAVLPAILGVCLFFNLLWQIYKRPATEQALIELDNRAGLKSKLITAYDQYKKGWPSPFSDLIREDIKKSSAEIKVKKYLPLKLPKLSISIPFLLLIIATLLIFRVPPHWFRNIDPAALQLGIKLEESAKRFAMEQEKDPDTGNMEIAKALEKLARELQNEALSKKEAKEKIDELAGKLADLNAKRDKSGPANGGEFSLEQEVEQALETMDQNQMDQADINDLKRRLTTAMELSPETKEKLADHFDNYERNPNPQAQNELAEQLREDLAEDLPGENPEEQSAAEKLEETLKGASRTMAQSELNDSDKQARGQAMGGASPDAEDLDSEGQREGGAGKAGTADTKDLEDSFVRRNSQLMESMDLENKISGSETVKAQAKILPSAPPEKKSMESIDLEYKKEIESEILKEEIPVSMREYIKDYFIGIGVLDTDPTPKN